MNTDYPIVQHCGQIDFLGCPISIDWESINQGDTIRISKVQKLLETNEKYTINYAGLETVIDKRSYIKEVNDFTENVIDFFKGHNPEIDDELDRKNYNLFWEELKQLY